MNRPAHLVVVAGTDTAVGKTWVTVAAASTLRRQGASVAARKPAQSFSGDERGSTDAELLAAATGEAAYLVCPRHRWYEVPMAPPMAADVLERPRFCVADLAGEVAESWTDEVDVGFVELAGGPRSPMADDGDGVDVADAIWPDLVVLVGDAGLGTINAVRLGVDALREVSHGLVVVLNRFDASDDLHVRNAAWLRARTGYDVVTSVDELVERVAKAGE